jgi:hypothetical protein
MMGQQPTSHMPSLQASQARSNSGTCSPRSSQLPGWESFGLADRQLLIRLIVQTARRQIPADLEPGR